MTVLGNSNFNKTCDCASTKCDLTRRVTESQNKQKTLTCLSAWDRARQAKSAFMPLAKKFPTSYGNDGSLPC